VTASVNNSQKSVEIAYYVPDFKSYVTSNPTHVYNITELLATPSKLLADGIAKASITATVKDLDGNPVEGVEVTFSTDFGTLNPNPNLTNSEGNASTILTSFKRDTNGTAKVTASVNNSQKSVEIAYYVLNTSKNNDLLNAKNRIWTEGMPNPYTWDAQTFSGFYYNLDDNVSYETLTITLSGADNRTVKKGELIYTTKHKSDSNEFNFEDWGRYEVIGFMAEKYFAGYKKDQSEVISKDKSMVSNGQLSKILIDSDAEYTISVGDSLDLQDGYKLKMVQIDLNGNKVQLALYKNGNKVDTAIITPTDLKSATYVYKKKVGSMDELPLILVHINYVFRGTTENMVSIDGIFQITEEYISINTGDDFGIMEVTRVDSSGITMKNDGSFTLGKDDTISIMGDLKFKVADNDTLRFALFVDRTGNYEIRGTVATGSYEWTPMNFDGLYYNLDDDIGNERLSAKVTDREIKEGDLVYTTAPDYVKFDFEDWGKYQVIGFLAEKYFAGYKKDQSEVISKDISVLSRGMLCKVLLDTSTEYTISAGDTLNLKQGYKLKMVQIDLEGNKVQLALYKDGNKVDTTIITPSDLKSATYVYKKEVGNVDDLPLILVHISEVFRGTEMNMISVDGIFQVSEDYTSVKGGNDYGEMEITRVSSSGITMRNDNSITLSRDSSISIIGNLKFKVADSSTLRYYPLFEVKNGYGYGEANTESNTATTEKPLRIDMPKIATVEQEITITVTSHKEPVKGAKITVSDLEAGTLDLGATDENGTLKYVPIESGNYTFTASKAGYQNATKEL
ncbi:MAG: S-layer protein domain-containing protein, partial [Methanosarcinales archaeon]